MIDDQFTRYLTVRFVIPMKIIIGAAIAALVNPNNIEVHRLIAHCVTYSFAACTFYVTGDFVFYFGKTIYRLIGNTKEEA